MGISCALELKDSTIISLKLAGLKLDGFIPPSLQNLTSLMTLSHGNSALCSLSGMLNLPACDSSSSLSPTLTFLEDYDLHKSIKIKEGDTVGGDLGIPSLPTFTLSSAGHAQKPRKGKLAAIIGSSICAAVIVTTVVTVIYICLMRVKRSTRRASEAESSAPSPQGRREGSPNIVVLSPYQVQGLRQLTFKELEHATSKFSQSNVIGEGGFGLVYKGLLQDGSIVVVKCRLREPSQHFIEEVANIGRIRHRHIVSLIGYCQECYHQLLVYDYMSNGNVANLLYDAEGSPIGRLNIRQRLSIALGAAKGLEYLHGLAPPLPHMRFKTSNVLVDENNTAKVADFGLSRLLTSVSHAGPSSTVDCFLDPELGMSNEFSKGSDVYAFGVFLLEIISGHEAHDKNISELGQNLVVQAKSSHDLDGFVDETLGEDAIEAIQHVMELALQCLETSERRLTMNQVVCQLEMIHEREIGLQQTAGLGEEIGGVTLGSELFK